MENKIRCIEQQKQCSSSEKASISGILSTFAFVLFFISSFTFSVQAADSSVIEEARNKIKQNYVTTVPDSVLNAPTIEEMIKGLNDPYSAYFSKQEQQSFVNTIDNKMYGIGIYLGIVPEGVKVKGVIETSPAAEVGIKQGDIIISADGKSLAGVASDEASSYIKGEEGTSVNLVIKRENSEMTFNVTRRSISIPTVEGKMLNDNAAYIQVSSFGTDTSDLFTKKLQELKSKNPEFYIIDLRNNGGGYMSTALDMAGNFIGEKRAIIIENKQGQKQGYLASDKGSVIDKPVFFLVNEYTASASEILSAAVKDYNEAFFIGTTTYGKGVAQQMFALSDGSYLKLTTEKFYSPKGNVIQKTGISPDFKVENVDSLAVADLFSGKCKNNVDKTGYVKVNAGGKDFEIDLNTAKDELHWAAFKYILSTVSKDNVYIGTKEGWTKAPQDYFNNVYKFFYSNVKALDSSSSVSKDKVFNVTFNKDVDENTIKNNMDIEIIDVETGERAAFDIKKVDGKKVSLVPKEELKSGETYYVKVKDTIKSYTVR
ncbi:PDZ domain-containing protein [Clostridium sp. P21]|uniref:PDZ domain-containing protein n=1 Tax=Clostridium muellerianum TaxID=2716538 RepID=A0A7Y0HRP1_9CLOT|nr:S41 family peptidase [Clostridium muellerianum]NMM65058.1 PDZ domain-containing protein [Clostridium muellerianum]